MEIGEFLALCREIKGHSLRQVEKDTGLSNAYLSQIETGKIKDFSFNTAILLCEHYSITLERLKQARKAGTQ